MAPPYNVGIIGLGVMGSPFALNILEHEMAVVAYDNDREKLSQLKQAYGKSDDIRAVDTLDELVNSLSPKRCIFLFLPAGKVIDSVLNSLIPLLDKGDCILDCGNSYFKNTDQRCEKLKAHGIHFQGTGISGGAGGARFGPSLMVGGPANGYRTVAPILNKVAARYKDQACVGYLGKNGAGHFTKMVHNGIEYGLMQLLAESYGILKQFNYSNEQLHGIFSYFNSGPLTSFLLEITAKIFNIEDPLGSGMLIDKISDHTGQKGTGKWTVETALELGVPVPTINAAVDMRHHSNQRPIRSEIRKAFNLKAKAVTLDDDILEKVYNALVFGYIATFAQGFDLLKKGSSTYNYEISLSEVARIWRAGCIIRTELLSPIAEDLALENLNHLMLGKQIGAIIEPTIEDAGYVLGLGNKSAYPMPALAASYSYFLIMTSEKLPLNLIQAQRDYFGGHGYERIDEQGKHTGSWKPQS